MDIPQEKWFHFRDGSSASGLEELQHKLEGISYQEFYHHVNQDKNDFASWIRHVLDENNLADELEQVSSIVETVEIIRDHLNPVVQHDDLQSRIEEQVFSTTIPKPGEADIEEVPMTQPVEAEHPESIDFAKIEQTLQGQEEKTEEEPSIEHTVTMSEHDRTRMIVKDFMYGLVFGLVVGLVLGRLISF